MNSTELLDYSRAQLVDAVRPYLWSDSEIFIFMNEAQSMFCRLTDGIADANTPEVTVVPVVTGEIFAETHPAILTFRNASLSSTGVELDIKNHTDIHKWANQTGQVTQMIIGLQDNLVRWNYTPAVDDEVNLLVYRRPLEDITDADQELEVDGRHHVSLVHWIKHLAFGKQDTETYDGNASEQAGMAFRAYCAQVKVEQERYKHKPRSVAYGGI